MPTTLYITVGNLVVSLYSLGGLFIFYGILWKLWTRRGKIGKRGKIRNLSPKDGVSGDAKVGR